MKVRKDFNQTEIGLLPFDWEVKSLAEIADIKTGPFGSSLHERDYVLSGTPIITVEHLGELGILHENIPMISDEDRDRLSSYILRRDDIVFSRVGSVDRNSIVSEKETGWLFSGRLLRIRLLKRELHAKYLSYHFHQESFKQRIRSVAVGQTMASLNTQILKSILVAIPSKLEQTAIATVLSDTDALISSLDKLIAKKRNIKQGAMQELLKPKKGWIVKKLGQIVDFWDGSRKPIKDTERAKIKGPYPYYGASGIIDYVNEYIFDDEIILLGEDGENIVSRNQKLAFKVTGKVWVNNHAHVLKPHDDIDIDFLTEKLESLNYEIYNTGTAQPKLNQKTCSSILIDLPKSRQEQAQISIILSDMELEIKSLESKLLKYRQIKSGMMQNLLTGKIRLI
jgi:type I restriction enzyme S subunit